MKLTRILLLNHNSKLDRSFDNLLLLSMWFVWLVDSKCPTLEKNENTF